MLRSNFIRWISGLHLIVYLIVFNTIAQEQKYRPVSGQFPSLEKAHTYRGELAFVDHANRRGSIRIDGNGRFRFTHPPLSPYCHTVW